MRWINAEKVIHTQIYDDGHEEWSEQEMTIEEFLDAFTDEGCPTVVTQPEPQWIPFKTRPLTEEEQDEHPEWNCILDCKLPDDGQTILVSINLIGHERVQYDEFYTDDGSYLDSGYAIGEEATAWMPLPQPWRGEEHEL